LKTKRSKIRV